jgi:hypothetical protein
MNSSDSILDRIEAEVLAAMPHVNKAIHYRTVLTCWNIS